MRNLVLVFILIFFFSVVALFLIRVQSEKTDKEKECFSYKGRWLSKYRECELRGLSEQEGRNACHAMGGKYEFCSSACRHDLKPGPCILVCIPICKF